MATHHRSKKSSYFPESTENSAQLQEPQSPEKYQQPHLVVGSPYFPSEQSFPFTATVLWDRTPIARSKYIHPASIIPALLLTSADIRLVLGQLLVSSNQKTDLKVSVVHNVQLTGIERDVVNRPFIGAASYIFTAAKAEIGNDTCAADCTVTIPIQRSSTSFDDSSTRNLIINLGKAVCKGREFSLKSCLRLRATGLATQEGAFCDARGGDANSSISSSNGGWSLVDTGMLSGSLRMEAIVPNVSFRFTPVQAVALCNGVLSSQLLKPSSGLFGNTPKMGYLTMNSVRRLVPLLESDAVQVRSPLVGLWVKFAAPWSQQVHPEQLLEHAYVWGACVRFLCSGYVQERALMDDSFLMLLMVGERAFHYEVSEVSPAGAVLPSPHSQGGDPSKRLTTPGEFLCADFSVDLSVDTSTGSGKSDRSAVEAAEAVVCKFRPLTRPEQVSAFHAASFSPSAAAASPHSAPDGCSPVRSSYTTPSVSPLPRTGGPAAGSGNRGGVSSSSACLSPKETLLSQSADGARWHGDAERFRHQAPHFSLLSQVGQNLHSWVEGESGSQLPRSSCPQPAAAPVSPSRSSIKPPTKSPVRSPHGHSPPSSAERSSRPQASQRDGTGYSTGHCTGNGGTENGGAGNGAYPANTLSSLHSSGQYQYLEDHYAASQAMLQKQLRSSFNSTDLLQALQMQLAEKDRQIADLQRMVQHLCAQRGEPHMPTRQDASHEEVRRSTAPTTSAAVPGATERRSNVERGSSVRDSVDASVSLQSVSESVAAEQNVVEEDAEVDAVGDVDGGSYGYSEYDQEEEDEYYSEDEDAGEEEGVEDEDEVVQEGFRDEECSEVEDEEVEPQVPQQKVKHPEEVKEERAVGKYVPLPENTAVGPGAGGTPQRVFSSSSGASAVPACAISSAVLKGNTATTRFSLGLNAAVDKDLNRDAPLRSSYSSIIAAAGTAAPSSVSSTRLGTSASSSYLSNDFEDATFVESESIIRIQARYANDS